MRLTSFQLLILALLLSPCGLVTASGFDQAAFERLDHDELRAAEARISDLVESGSGRALREPTNEAEAYVIARQQRLASAMTRRQEAVSLSGGVQAQPLFWSTARATRITVGPGGLLTAECVPATSLLGHTPPDFRDGNHPQEMVR